MGMSQKELIRTKIKFSESKKDGTTLVGYVTQNERGIFRGCRESENVKKKVVIPDHIIAQGMVANVLYDCALKPMSSGSGFIAVEADICKFPAVIDTQVSNNRFKVEVKFGGKCIIYDPQLGVDDSRKTVEGALSALESRVDIRDKGMVIKTFLSAANMVHALYKEYRNHQL
jgi:hypothetical protein